MVLEHVVVSRVKPNGHTCSMSPELLKISPHVRERIENESHINKKMDLACAYNGTSTSSKNTYMIGIP
ncbi:hypothetical protein DVH24_015393 [Malus domestica]|uniref:Uncharacterized protein n=1 Tax=Malus domestica TaxID=3750 RepID=A0A498K6X9_MALDO|nr:hypothetical protein DVH24_015393 [Malus domestica]